MSPVRLSMGIITNIQVLNSIRHSIFNSAMLLVKDYVREYTSDSFSIIVLNSSLIEHDAFVFYY